MNAAGSVTWWGGAGVEIVMDGRCVLIDPYLHPKGSDVHAICITHNDYDHCHEPTLRGLTARSEFERLFVPMACCKMTELDSPVLEDPPPTDLEFVPEERLTVLYPKYRREPDAEYPGPTEATIAGFRIETVDSSERPRRYRPHKGAIWPVGTGPYAGLTEYPNLGYLITHERTGISFYHPGDLHEVFDSHLELRGKVDYMIFPSVKLEGLEETILDAIRPRYLLPIHYRLDTPDFPLPLTITADELRTTDLSKGLPRNGADLGQWRDDIHAMMAGSWYPTRIPGLARVEEIADGLAAFGTELLLTTAGKPHPIPDESHVTKGGIGQ